MNIGAAAVVLRPRTITEVFDLACRFSVTVARGLFMKLFAIVLAPVLAGCLALRYALGWDWAGVWLLAIPLSALLEGVFTVAVGRLLFAPETGAREVLRAYFGRLASHAVALVSGALLVAAGALVLFVPALYAITQLVFVREASLLEGAGPFTAIRRSGRFVSGRLGDAALVLFGLFVARAAIVIAAELCGAGILNGLLQLGSPLGSLLDEGGSAFAIAGLFAAAPYAATARFLQYIDDRTRADGWDVQARFTAIAAAAEADRRAA